MKGSFHLAEWEIQPQINCVVRGDRSVHLEPKVMQVLVQLASHPNEVLSKENLIHAVWPDTFVGDDVLTRSISEIRRVLEDDARSPRFIQTIPKTGYRLIAPVTFASDTPVQVSVAPTVAVAAPTVPPPPVVIAAPMNPAAAPPPVSKPKTSGLRIGVIVLAIAVAVGLGVWNLSLRRHAAPEYKTVPLTSNIGAETQPSFSPDGSQVAYVWNGDSDGFQHIYVKLIGTEGSLKLTSGNADDFSPTWSPDGRSVAFMRVSPNERGIYIVPAIGGAARKVFERPTGLPDWTPLGKIEWDRGSLSWSPDGKHLVFPDGKTSKSPSSIYALDLTTMEAKPLTTPASNLDGDFSPAYSPDGSKIAFVRGLEGAVRDIYVMDAEGGNPRRITADNRFVSGIAWTKDSAALVFSSNRGGKFSLWRVALKGGEPERLPVGADDAFTPAVSVNSNRLAYAQRSAKWSIVKVDLKSSKAAPVRLLSSTQQDSAPRYSPDGSKIAFQSWRSGNQEIWISSANGSDLVKLTSFEGPLTGSPAWSPDGQTIAFDSRPQGHSQIYVIGVTGGRPRAITDGNFNDIVPSYSHDGKWIYFGSNRSGGWQVWKVPVGGGTPQQVTTQGGFVGVESADGKWLYFARADSAGIWRMPVDGGDETKVLPQPAVGYWGYWTFRGNELFYVTESTTAPAIEAYDLTTQRTRRILQLTHVPPPFSGIAISPDGSSLLYTDLTEVGSHITLVENFE